MEGTTRRRRTARSNNVRLGFSPSAVTVEVVDLAKIAHVFEGRRVAVARSIYLGLVELCGRGETEFSRADLADMAGVTRKTLDDYIPAFEAAGMLHVERRREGSMNLPNVWTLMGAQPSAGSDPLTCVYCGEDADTLDHVVPGGGNRGNVAPACRGCNSAKGAKEVEGWVDGSERAESWPVVRARLAAWGVRSVATHGNDPEQSSSSNSESGEEGGGASASLPTLLPGLGGPLDAVRSMVPPEMLEDAAGLLGRKSRVDGRVVSEVEMARAAAALAEFNRQADADFGLGANLRSVVMRIRERPAYGEDALIRLVQSAWRIRWWEKNGRRGGRVTPSVIFGNAQCFENVVQDATDEAKGRERLAAAPAGRYTRED